MILTDVAELLKNPVNSEAIKLASEKQDDHRVHVTGEGYQKYIKQILEHEDAEQFARKKELAEPVTTILTKRIIDEQSRWKNCPGPNVHMEWRTEDLTRKMRDILSQVWQGESIEYFVNNFLAKAIYTEFNGFIIVEQGQVVQEDGKYFEIRDGIKSPIENNDIKPYLIFRSIDEVIDFKSNGNKIEYLILDWGERKIGEKTVKLYRVIDDLYDRIYINDSGEFSLSEEDPVLENPLGFVPAIQISTNIEKPTISEVKTSYIWQIIPLLKTYLTLWAEHVITCILHSHPIYYQLGQKCTYEDDDGACDEGYIHYSIDGQPKVKTCPNCHGTGAVVRKSASSAIILPQLDENGQAYNPSEVAGYVTPPVDAIKAQIDELNWIAENIIQSGTGMNKTLETTIEKTATEAILNYKPLEQIISEIIDNIEYVHTWIINTIGKLVFKNDFKRGYVSYSRQLNLRDENVLLNEIKEAKEAGASASYVRNLHEELINVRYQHSPIQLERNIILSKLEPFVGFTPMELVKYWGVESSMKINFTDYIVRFELEHGLIQDYMDNKPLEERIKGIQEILIKYDSDSN